MDNTRDVTTADGTFGKLFTTVCARHHVTTFQQYAVNDGVHAHLTQVIGFDFTRTGIGCNQNMFQDQDGKLYRYEKWGCAVVKNDFGSVLQKKLRFSGRFQFHKISRGFVFLVQLGLHSSVDIDAIFHLHLYGMTLEMTYFRAELVRLTVR